MNWRSKNKMKVGMHFLVIVGFGFLLIYLFFNVYLPSTTNHGETITVPDVYTMHIDKVENFLGERGLRYEVKKDSIFDPAYAPQTVLLQYPPAGTKVKQKRKLYLTLNAKMPPKTPMPLLIGLSLNKKEIVENILSDAGLKLGALKYRPDLAENVILEQWCEGQKLEKDSILAGIYIAKGTRIDIVVGDGLGANEFETPELIGMPIDEAEVSLAGAGLKLGSVIQREMDEIDSAAIPGQILKQRPLPGTMIRTGAVVDVWIVATDSLMIDDYMEEQDSLLYKFDGDE